MQQKNHKGTEKQKIVVWQPRKTEEKPEKVGNFLTTSPSNSKTRPTH